MRAAWPAFDRDFHVLFAGFDGLVQAGAPLAPFGHAAGELVDDHHLAVAHDVLPIAEELAIDLDRPLDVFVDGEHADGVHRVGLGQRADQAAALGRQLDRLLLVIVFVVFVLLELARPPRRPTCRPRPRSIGLRSAGRR